MRTARCSGRLPCHARHPPFHACPPPPTTHIPLPCMSPSPYYTHSPAMHVPRHACPPAMHTPTPLPPATHGNPWPRMPPPPLWTDRHQWKHYFSKLPLWAVITVSWIKANQWRIQVSKRLCPFRSFKYQAKILDCVFLGPQLLDPLPGTLVIQSTSSSTTWTYE